jgi:Family of unknown function (DUF6494)
VTSQREIECVVREGEARGPTLRLKMTLTSKDAPSLRHVVETTIPLTWARCQTRTPSPARMSRRRVAPQGLGTRWRGRRDEMPDSTANQDRADRKLAKYISRRNLAIGIIVLAVVILTAIVYGSL